MESFWLRRMMSTKIHPMKEAYVLVKRMSGMGSETNFSAVQRGCSLSALGSQQRISLMSSHPMTCQHPRWASP